MRRRALAVLASFALIAGAVVGVAPAASAVEPPNPGGDAYVALGDSMASGNGNLPYLDTTCLRSKRSYPMLVGAQLGTGVTSVACSGATTMDVGMQLQGLVMSGGIGATTQLVTVTAGINNLHWQDALIACGTPGQEAACGAALQVMATAAAALPTDLGMLLGSIRMAAPNALIVVTGYPKLFGDGITTCSLGNFNGTPVKLDGSLTALANLLVDGADDASGMSDPSPGLNDAIAFVASQVPGTLFADVDATFATHRLCDSGDRWISGFVNGVPKDRGLHPNAAGQQAFAWTVLNTLP